MQVLTRIILAVALVWHPLLGLAGSICAAAAAARACPVGPSCCCGGDGTCPMSGPGMGCDCGGDQQVPAAPAPSGNRGERCAALALAPVLCAVVAPPIVAFGRLGVGTPVAPRRDGPSVQSILCVWLT